MTGARPPAVPARPLRAAGRRTSSAARLLAVVARECVLLAGHPAHLTGLAILAGAISTNHNPVDLGFQLLVFYGFPVYVAANRCASRVRRYGVADLLSATPISVAARTLAVSMSSVVPFAVACVVVVGCVAFPSSDQGFDVSWSAQRQAHELGVLLLLAGPLTVFALGLVGVLAAEWLPYPGAASFVILGVWVAYDRIPGDSLFGPAGNWVTVSVERGARHPAIVPGSPAWHTMYLVGMCVMVASAAVARAPAFRRRALLITVAATALTIVGGLAQLP